MLARVFSSMMLTFREVGFASGLCRSFSLYFEWRLNLHNGHTSPTLELVLACKSHSIPKYRIRTVGGHPFRVPKAFFIVDQQSFILTFFLIF